MTKVPRVNINKRSSDLLDFDFLEGQKQLFQRFMDTGIQFLLDEINPVLDYTNGSSWELHFEDVEWGRPKYSFAECQSLGLTYEVPIYINVKLINKKTGSITKQKLYLTDMPIMGERASFMINGNERVVVFQIFRAEGLLIDESKNSTLAKPLYSVKLMPMRGNWYEFEVNKSGVMSIRLIQKRPRILLTTLLRALGYSSDDDIRRVLSVADVDEVSFVENTLNKDVTKNTEEALVEIFKKLRPEDNYTYENAKNIINSLFFNKRRFFLGKVGRYKLNKKFGIDKEITQEDLLLRREDIVEVIKVLIKVNNGTIEPDDVDSLAYRRLRGVDEFLLEYLRSGFLLMEKYIKDRMSLFSTDEKVTPSMVVNTKPVISAVNQFFGSSVIVRFLDQENPFAEIEAKRRITAGGPRGLIPERATFSVRDVHNSHYSRLCPVTTPEGPNIGTVNQLAIYSKINEYGFLEAPYKIVRHSINLNEDPKSKCLNRILLNDINIGSVLLKVGDYITEKSYDLLKTSGIDKVDVVSFVDDKIIYLDAYEELNHRIASAAIKVDEFQNIVDEQTYVRDGSLFTKVNINEIDLIDVLPAQIAGLGLALIPFGQSDDTARSMLASKMLNQAIPLVKPESPIVGTGFERLVAKATSRSIFAKEDGYVVYSDSNKLVVKYESGELKDLTEEYFLETFVRTNQDSCFTQIVRVHVGDKFKKGDVLVDGPSTENGELALGVNLRVAYLFYDGYNFEDGIVISERLVKDDILTSVHIQEYSQEIRDTKLGPEQVTRDIPNISEYALRNLGEDGIVRIGAYVESNDVLVGIVAPKGETELSAEEKLLRAIFGEYSKEVKDNSLRMPYGEKGVVLATQVLTPDDGAKLSSGVIKLVKVWVAKTHKISVGDKLTGLHGEKGVITKILPEEDMPYLEDGTRVDIILNPMGMVKRMNTGQLNETYVGEIASQLGIKIETQPFSEYDIEKILQMAKEKGICTESKYRLYDGRTGMEFNGKVFVGQKYFLKLDHLADKKIHARSTGPYTLVTQQPLRGKAQKGGRRFGEMEVWAMEAHAVPYVLHEMLTIKSDDIVGRSAAYKAIITGSEIRTPNIPESFNVLDKELAGLAIKLEKINPVIDEKDESLEEVIDSIGAPSLEQTIEDISEDLFSENSISEDELVEQGFDIK